MIAASFASSKQMKRGTRKVFFFRDDKLDDLIAAIHDFKKKGNEEVKV